MQPASEAISAGPSPPSSRRQSRRAWRRIWGLHSWLGLFCGLALLVIGLSGGVLVFHEELSAWTAPDVVLVEPGGPNRERLELHELIQEVEAAHPDYWVRGWLPRYGSDRRDQAYMKRRDAEDTWHILYVDPYTAATSERPLRYRETLYGWFVELHYTFFAGHIGIALAGLFGVAFIVLGMSGIYLYRDFWKNLFRLRWRRSLRIFCSSLHKTLGILTVPMNLLLGFTGAYWNIAHTVEDWDHLLSGHDDPVEQPMTGAEDTLPELIAAAQAHWPGFSLNYLYFPTADDPHFWFYGQTPSSNPLRSPYGSYLQIHAETAEIGSSDDLRTAGFWRQVVDAFEPLHFGNFGGLPTKILWFIAGLSPAILSLSGTAIWWQRRRSRRRRIAG